MGDLQKRALALHEAGVIALDYRNGRRPLCVGCSWEVRERGKPVQDCSECVECAQAAATRTAFDLSPGAILLACVRAGVGVWQQWVRDPVWCASVSDSAGLPVRMVRPCPVDAALSVLEAASC